MSETGDIDLQFGGNIAVGARKPEDNTVLLNALVQYYFKATNVRASLQRIAKANGIPDRVYEKRLENEAVILSLEAALPEKRAQVTRPKDKALLCRALAALFIRNEATEQRRQQITEMAIEIGIDLEAFDTACAELKVPDDPERNLEWRSKDGQTVTLADMADSHLLNAILFLERSAAMNFAGELLLTFALAKYKPSQAERDALSYAKGQEKPEAPPMYWAMIREAERRGMTLPPPKNKDEAPREKLKVKAASQPGGRAFNFEDE